MKRKQIELRELKQALKPLGFTITTKSYSSFTSACLKHISTKYVDSGNVYSESRYLLFKPAFDYLQSLGFFQLVRDGYGLVFAHDNKPNK